MCTSLVAVKFIFALEAIVKSVSSPSIFSPSSPNVTQQHPELNYINISIVKSVITFISSPELSVKFLSPLPEIYLSHLRLFLESANIISFPEATSK